MVAKETTKPISREEVKKAKKSKKEQENNEESRQKVSVRVRLLPIWARVLLVLILMVVSTIAGLIVGYGVIGSGEPKDALEKTTWQHIIDLVEKE